MANGVLMRGDVSLTHKSWFRLLRQELLRRRKLRRKQRRESGDEEEDDSGLMLPMELMEKILARVPFPDVFKGRVLSRSWRRKFSLASQQTRPWNPLLDELSSAAVGWPTFCPLYMTPEGSLVGFNHTSLNWENLVISSYIPMNRTHSNLVVGRKVEFGGSLLCIFEENMPFFHVGDGMMELFVANMQTGAWKTIVCPKRLELSRSPQVVLINEPGSEEYRILVYEVNRPNVMAYLGGIDFEVHIYDSASRTWRSHESSYMEAGRFVSSYCTASPRVHVDGSIYLMGPGLREDPLDHSVRHVVDIMKYSMVDDVWFKSTSAIQVKNDQVCDVGGVFFCGSKLVLVTLDTDQHMEQYSVRPFERGMGDDCRRDHKRRPRTHGAYTYEVCPETLVIESVSTSPAGILKGICRSLMSDDDNIYFFCSNCPGKTKALVVRYNVSEQSWDRLPPPPTEICRNTVWARSAYVPGRNPFAPV